MVAPVAPAALHLLTPGSPAYAMLKVGAIGSIFALRFVLVRRQKARAAEKEPEPERRHDEHPVSRKKRRRRRR